MGRSARHAPGDLRRINTIAVSRSRRAGGGPRADQGQAWDRVAAYQADLGAPSPTSALEDVYGRVESDLFRLVGELTPLPDQRGVIVAICGTVRGIDWFDKASTLKAYWPGLVQGYAVDALHTPNGEATMDDANALVAQVLAAETSTDNAFGLGRGLTISEDAVAGHALEWSDAIVHLAAFATGTTEARPRAARRIDRSQWRR